MINTQIRYGNIIAPPKRPKGGYTLGNSALPALPLEAQLEKHTHTRTEYVEYIIDILHTCSVRTHKHTLTHTHTHTRVEFSVA